ncbi:MAG: adenylate kinase [Chloroflexi bacterium]|nr:adenylate kinase [Chloroflexota bacterium]
MFVVLLGPPGAGKGTQAQALSKQLGIPHVATGDLFREAVANQTRLGRLAQPYLERGELVPDEITIGLVREQLERSASRRGVLLDGFPRTVEQARGLSALLTELGKRVNIVLRLSVPSDELVRRLSQRWTCRQCGAVYQLRAGPPDAAGTCGACRGELYQRTDDTPEVVRRRLQVYFERTDPLVSFYRQAGFLVDINGDQEVNAVTDEILRALNQRRLVNPMTLDGHSGSAKRSLGGAARKPATPRG